MWIVLSLFTALCEAIKDGLCKKGLQGNNFLVIAWAWKAFSLPFLLPLSFITPVPEYLSLRFLGILALGGGLNILATILYIRAIQASDLSLTLPLLSFTPIFLLFTSPLMVGDKPEPTGFLGVFLIFLGSYILGSSKPGFWGPIKGLFSEKGPRLMLCVALIWSIAANVDKMGIRETSPFFWAFCVQAFIASGLTLLLFKQQKSISLGSRKNIFLLSLIGLFTAMGLISQMSAVNIGLVPYVIAIKRLSIVFGVIIGALVFKEKDLKLRLCGAMIMLAGVFLMTA
ncbi:EamA family transporter [Desulfohalobiaceae bacterium Ax17]|uniref:EamA family transporter n=1 Tax=Desulfovulcanus ferrireducens TaxID=2831190 RepID=UPI00207BBD01|nr:DMT family transporter [Desulfovulcanus ferrireducens]MBT8763552.1 EamA family transporter [Desulfovulcanus ferrireducens]